MKPRIIQVILQPASGKPFHGVLDRWADRMQNSAAPASTSQVTAEPIAGELGHSSKLPGLLRTPSDKGGGEIEGTAKEKSNQTKAPSPVLRSLPLSWEAGYRLQSLPVPNPNGRGRGGLELGRGDLMLAFT